jgi:hypothetical protein
MKDLFIENFGGIRQTRAVTDLCRTGKISAVSCRNVELKYTQKSGNVAIFSTHGNKVVCELEQKIVGQFESVQNGVFYHFIYACDETRGYLYCFDQQRDKLELLSVELSVSAVCNGITVAQGYDDWFVFTNGVDDYVGVCLGQTDPNDRIQFLNATDAEDREIRGLALEVQDGRLVTACENRVHWSAQANIFDWSSSQSNLVTIPAYQEFDRPVTAIACYHNGLIAFTDESSVVFSGNPGDASSFSRSGATGGGCASYRSLVKFDNRLFYYDQKARNVFAYYLLDTGQTRPSSGYADDVLSYFDKLSPNRIREIEMFSYVSGEKSEIWLKLPTEDENLILIYDYLKSEWVERSAQADISAFAVVDGILYSASENVILRENMTSTFNGIYKPSEYKTGLINLGSDSNVKIPKMPLIMTLDWEYDNDFYIEFIYDDNPERSCKKHIVKLIKGYLI